MYVHVCFIYSAKHYYIYNLLPNYCLQTTTACLPAMQETRVRSLGQEDPLEKEMATHSSTLAWKIPWTEEPGRLQSMGTQLRDFTSFLLYLGY